MIRLGPVVAWPAVLCALMLACALVTSAIAGIDFSGLFLPYLAASAAITFLSLLLTLFWWVVQLARIGADEPAKAIAAKLRERLPLLLLPALIFPLFLASYTATKTAIPFIAGYGWDAFWADTDRLIFGDDAWRITQGWFGTRAMVVWQWFYTFAWGLVLIFTSALVALNARPRLVAVFYTAMMASWLIGGVALAYSMSAAGPVFAHLFDPALGPRFAPLREMLSHSLAQNGPIRMTQSYLAGAVDLRTAAKGGGISAMPSMHLAAASIYVIAARRTPWLLPAIGFWLIIFVGSAHFGYHYWVDGIVAAGVAVACWAAAVRLLGAHGAEAAAPQGALQPVTA